MTLKQIVEEIKQIKTISEEDVDSGPAETLNGRRGRKKQAIEKLKLLKRDYSKELLRSAVFIVSTGKDRNKFAEIASSKEINFFTADPEEFYADLAKRVPPVLYQGREGISNVFDVLGRHLEDKMNELDIFAYNQLIFKGSYARKSNSLEEFQGLVKEAINDQIGSEIVGIQAVNSLVPQAIERSHADVLTPVVLTTGDESLVNSLMKDLSRLTSRVFLVVSGEATQSVRSIEDAMVIEDPTKDAVKKALTTIKKTLKTK